MLGKGDCKRKTELAAYENVDREKEEAESRLGFCGNCFGNGAGEESQVSTNISSTLHSNFTIMNNNNEDAIKNETIATMADEKRKMMKELEDVDRRAKMELRNLCTVKTIYQEGIHRLVEMTEADHLLSLDELPLSRCGMRHVAHERSMTAAISLLERQRDLMQVGGAEHSNTSCVRTPLGGSNVLYIELSEQNSLPGGASY